MSLLSGLTIGLFRETRDGRRVIGLGPVGFPKAWYQVSDAAAPVIERRFTRFYAGMYLVFFPVLIAVSGVTDSGVNWWLIAAMVLLSPFAMRYWVLRDITRTTVTETDLISVDRKARNLAQSQAIGEPALWLLLVAGFLMAILALVVAIADGDWWAWLSAVMFGTLTVMMGRQIVAVRHVRR